MNAVGLYNFHDARYCVFENSNVKIIQRTGG
jgi:hypothetical protein